VRHRTAVPLFDQCSSCSTLFHPVHTG
jgi:hypothetical protein